MNIKIALILFVVIVVGAGYWYVNQPKTNPPAVQEINNSTTTPSENIISAVFNCDKGIVIKADFHNDDPQKVVLQISDGRKIELPRAMSGSGARYADAQENFVFWNKGDTAFVEENGTTTISGCLTK